MNVKHILSKRLILPLPVCGVLILLGSFGITATALMIQPNGLGDLMACMEHSKGLVLLVNFLPVLLLMLALFFLSGSFSISLGATTFIILGAATVNRLKILFRNDPFLPWDVMLGGEALVISKAFGMKTVIVGVILIVSALIFFAGFVFFVRNRKINLIVRICGFFVILITSLGCNKYLFKNYEINQSFYVVGNRYNQVDIYNSKGFVYSFIYSYNTSRIVKPEGYSPAEIESRVDSFQGRSQEELSQGQRPNIIMILGEGYSELPMSPVLNYNGYVDPMENYKKLKTESISGYMVVPNYGGGTADTEFDILTGINVRHFRGVPYGNMLVTKEFPSFASVLNSAGYVSEAIHPGYSWFYNRANVYRFFGFREFIDIKYFDEKDNKGMYMSERATFDRIIYEYEAHKAENGAKPYFNFCLTIQNHGPYEDKYMAEKNFNSEVPLRESDINAISNYNEGVTDTDRELKRLADYFKASDDPTIIIFWGDHLPLLTNEACDALLGKPEDPESFEGKTRLYKTPFLIWENDAAKKIIPNQWDYENNDIISSSYLGAAILEYLGLGGVDPYFDFINDVKKEYPVVLERQFFTRDRVLYDSTQEKNTDLELLRKWEYYKIFDAN